MTHKIYLSTVAPGLMDAKMKFLLDAFDIEFQEGDLEPRDKDDRNDLNFDETEVDQE